MWTLYAGDEIWSKGPPKGGKVRTISPSDVDQESYDLTDMLIWISLSSLHSSACSCSHSLYLMIYVVNGLEISSNACPSFRPSCASAMTDYALLNSHCADRSRTRPQQFVTQASVFISILGVWLICRFLKVQDAISNFLERNTGS